MMTTMKPRVLAALAQMALAPALLTAQESVTSAPSTVRLQAQGQSQAQAQGQSQAQASQGAEARINAALTAAATAGVPADLVRSKIAEGEAKGVARERIAVAVEARVRSLTRAAEAMRRADVEFQTSGELAVTADALDAGVSEASVVRVSREAPPERRTVAIAVLADLVRLGHPSDRATLRVTSALSTSAALANLHAEVVSQLRLGGLTSTLEGAGRIRVP